MRSFLSSEYSSEFYEGLKETKNDSELIVKLLMDLFEKCNYKVDSVVDFGCGIGQWLDSFQKFGEVSEIKGFDGDRVGNQIIIPSESFEVVDLSKPVKCGNKRYDLAISFEVAEHVDEQFADIFIDNMVNVSDVIVFSAAIPYQGGTHHVNCQWQSYWVEKFKERGYEAVDYIRPAVWNHKVAYYYAQNMILYFKNNSEKTQKFKEYLHMTDESMLDIVHPDLWVDYMKRWSEMTSLDYFKNGIKEVLNKNQT